MAAFRCDFAAVNSLASKAASRVGECEVRQSKGCGMTNKEILELAAKAYGLEGYAYVEAWGCMAERKEGGGFHLSTHWSPLDDDGHALRLAVKLNLTVEAEMEIAVWPSYGTGADVCVEEATNDPYAATRLAITRCAAEIGKRMVRFHAHSATN